MVKRIAPSQVANSVSGQLNGVRFAYADDDSFACKKKKDVANAKKSPMARVGKSNGRWKGGVSKTYYRRIAGAKPNDGTIVHHKDHNKKNASKKNLEKIKPGKGISARGKHNQRHPNRRNGKA